MELESDTGRASEEREHSLTICCPLHQDHTSLSISLILKPAPHTLVLSYGHLRCKSVLTELFCPFKIGTRIKFLKYPKFPPMSYLNQSFILNEYSFLFKLRCSTTLNIFYNSQLLTQCLKDFETLSVCRDFGVDLSSLFYNSSMLPTSVAGFTGTLIAIDLIDAGPIVTGIALAVINIDFTIDA